MSVVIRTPTPAARQRRAELVRVRRPRRARWVAALAAGLALALAGCGGGGETATFNPLPSAEPDASPTTPPFDGWVDPASVGKPYPNATVQGLLAFRGNPTRTFYGTGPMPRTTPVRAWRFPDTPMCGLSADETHNGQPYQWCGSGWTGQPAVFERDGRTWVVFGAYDYNVHFVDAMTGKRIISDFHTGDIIKGSVTVDPDGYPLVYIGSRDNYFRVISFDQGKPVELWKLSAYAVSPTKWNNDWDGNALVIDDYLFEGGENSQFHIVKLNRGYDANGKVTVNPQLVFNTPSWDDQLIRDCGCGAFSIEGSVAIYKNTVYWANSAGLVQGWDISGLKEGRTPTRVFRFWTGDDTDASIVIDEEGFLYVASEYEKKNARSKEVGQMMKLDPSKPDNPLVWSVKDLTAGNVVGGVWGTPALYQDIAIFMTTGGRVFGIDRVTGEERWKFVIPGLEAWMSPVVVDDVMMISNCSGILRAYDVKDTHAMPTELWNFTINPGTCLEATPAVWNGRIYISDRQGYLNALVAA